MDKKNNMLILGMTWAVVAFLIYRIFSDNIPFVGVFISGIAGIIVGFFIDIKGEV